MYILLWEFQRSDDGCFSTDLFRRHLFLELKGSPSCMCYADMVRNAEKEWAEQDCSWDSVISGDAKPCQPASRPQLGISNGHLPVTWVWSLRKHKPLHGHKFSFLSSVIWLLWLKKLQAGENMLPVSLPSCIYLSPPIWPTQTHAVVSPLDLTVVWRKPWSTEAKMSTGCFSAHG